MSDPAAVPPKPVTLHDGRTITIRRLAETDRAALLAFGAALPDADKLYLEDDLQSPEIVTRLVNAFAAENWRQVVAADDGNIIGYTMVRRLPGWSSHVGDILLVVSSAWRGTGVGTALAQAIFAAAGELGVEKLIVEVLDEHTAGRAIFRKLGFRVEGVLGDHARARNGEYHDLMIMSYYIK